MNGVWEEVSESSGAPEQQKNLSQEGLSRGANIRIGLLISAISLFVMLGAIELAGYVWERNTAQGPLGWTLVASRRMGLELQGSRDNPYYLLSPNEDYIWEEIPVHINSRGFRGEEFTLIKPNDTFRVLNLGDSIAFGWEVSHEDTYGKVLERELTESDPGRRYEVINAGIPAWNLEAERNFLIQEGLSYEPDVVLLDITLVNDIYGQGPAVSQRQTIFQWLRDHTYGWPFLTTQMRFLLSGLRGPEAMPTLNPPRDAASYYPLDENNPTWDEVWMLISEMHAASKDEGIPFIIVAFPTAFQVNSAAHPDIPQRVLAQKAEAAGIPFVDLLPNFREACEAAGRGECEGYENALFADVWMHPNTLGHQIAADALTSALSQ